MQAALQEKVEALQAMQKTQQKTLVARQTLDSQLNENKLVKEELDRLEGEAKVFKLIGPALIKQDTSEAKQNVDKRIQYISGELKRHDATLADLDKKQDNLKDELTNLQAQMQKLALFSPLTEQKLVYNVESEVAKQRIITYVTERLENELRE